MSQKEYVEACYEWYDYEGITPGDDKYGVWQKAHYPLPAVGPKREGPWVYLLRCHHAVQGVLQSDEVGKCHIWDWEKRYLDGPLYERYEHWRSALGRAGGHASTQMQKERGIGWWDPKWQKEKSGYQKGANARKTPVKVTRQTDGEVFYFESLTEACTTLNLNLGLCSSLKDTGKPTKKHIIESFN